MASQSVTACWLRITFVNYLLHEQVGGVLQREGVKVRDFRREFASQVPVAFNKKKKVVSPREAILSEERKYLRA